MKLKLYIYNVTDIAKEAKKKKKGMIEENKRGKEGRKEEQEERGILKDIQDVNTLSLTLKTAEMWREINFSSKIQENSAHVMLLLCS